jgi:DNA-binding transcriptional LysR family regulator
MDLRHSFIGYSIKGFRQSVTRSKDCRSHHQPENKPVAACAGRMRMPFAQPAMGRIGAGFFAIYPDDTIEVVADDRLADLVEQQSNIANRIYRSPDSALVGRRFAEDQLVAMTAP